MTVTYASQKYTDANAVETQMLMMGFTIVNSGPDLF